MVSEVKTILEARNRARGCRRDASHDILGPSEFPPRTLSYPYISYDAREAFQQQLTITNNGPFAIYDVHYTCAVLEIRLNDGPSGGWSYTAVYVMFPVVKPWIKTLRWKERTNTDCDFISRFGPDLKSVDIEIDVTYKRWPGTREIEAIGGRFFGQEGFSWELCLGLWIECPKSP